MGVGFVSIKVMTGYRSLANMQNTVTQDASSPIVIRRSRFILSSYACVYFYFVKLKVVLSFRPSLYSESSADDICVLSNGIVGFE